MDFSTSEITQKKVRGNNVDYLTIEITSKKVRGNNHGFLTIEITSKKMRGNNADYSTSEITSKKYVEMTWKFVEIRFNVECPLGSQLSNAIKNGIVEKTVC